MSVHVDISKALNKFKMNSQEVLESIKRKVLTRSCVRIRDYARKHHPRWENRTGALERAITFRFIRKWEEAEVYISESKLYDELEKRAKILDSYKKYKQGEDVGRNAIFLDYRFYPADLIEGTRAHSSKIAKALRFVDREGHIRFVRKPNKVRGITGDDFLANARNRISVKDIVREVLSEYGIKST